MSEKDSNSAPNRRKSSLSGDDDGLDERLERLKSRLDNSQLAAKSRNSTENQSQSSKTTAGIGQAFRLSSEFIAGVVVGAGIGYLVDTFFGTSPWGMIVFLLLGFAAAVLNVMRAAGMVAESQMRLKPAHDLHNQPQNDESDDQAKK
ncbi:MAG: AtpZ/AtpI family protein [Rhizobiaceae bacterium]